MRPASACSPAVQISAAARRDRRRDGDPVRGDRPRGRRMPRSSACFGVLAVAGRIVAIAGALCGLWQNRVRSLGRRACGIRPARRGRGGRLQVAWLVIVRKPSQLKLAVATRRWRCCVTRRGRRTQAPRLAMIEAGHEASGGWMFGVTFAIGAVLDRLGRAHGQSAGELSGYRRAVEHGGDSHRVLDHLFRGAEVAQRLLVRPHALLAAGDRRRGGGTASSKSSLATPGVPMICMRSRADI